MQTCSTFGVFDPLPKHWLAALLADRDSAMTILVFGGGLLPSSTRRSSTFKDGLKTFISALSGKRREQTPRTELSIRGLRVGWCRSKSSNELPIPWAASSGSCNWTTAEAVAIHLNLLISLRLFFIVTMNFMLNTMLKTWSNGAYALNCFRPEYTKWANNA